MTIKLITVGRTSERCICQAIEQYTKRLTHYCKFDIETLPDIKNAAALTAQQLKEREAELILAQIQPSDHVVLLDEQGKMRTSEQNAQWLQSLMNRSVKRLVFVIGGAFGFGEAAYGRANEKMSLSAMTFSHQMVRLIFVEQLYRTHTILNNQPYHHS